MTETFIKKAIALHGEKYDYSLVDYKTAKTKIRIICTKHGEFSQTPNTHLRGSGCPKCGREKIREKLSLDKEIFIERAESTHGKVYDYSNVVYVNIDTDVDIVCPEHGLFTRTPYAHLNGIGCHKCTSINRKNYILSKLKSDFIENAKRIHNNKYDYSLVDYRKSTVKVKIICPEHGVFEQTPYNHLKRGCNKCGYKKSDEEVKSDVINFINSSQLVHGDIYDYSKIEQVKHNSKVTIGCPTHGYFRQLHRNHLKGQGCPKCGVEKLSKSKTKPLTYYLNNSYKYHGDKYDYSLVDYVNANTKVKIICPEHGVFEQELRHHANGHGCAKCGNNVKKDFSVFLKQAEDVHGNKYDYSKAKYLNGRIKCEIICPKHGSFWQSPHMHVNRQQGCPKCVHQVSKSEQEIFDFVNDVIKCEQSNRKIMKGKELDIFIPNLNIAVEYHGLYWHSDKFREKGYHLDKLLKCEKKGIRLVQIFEDEWVNKQEICKSRLLNLVGKTPNKIFARKCEIREVDSTTAGKFLDENHIQGKLGSKIKLGLYFENELVSLMTFGSLRKNLGQTAKEGSYELLRFCNKLNTNVIGGASKLLSYFEKNFHPSEIISYADRRWSDGNLYKQLNFELVSASQPNYFYTKGLERENRFKYRKSELVKQGFDPNKTEKQIMEELGYVRIYDCGTLKFVKNLVEQNVNIIFATN